MKARGLFASISLGVKKKPDYDIGGQFVLTLSRPPEYHHHRHRHGHADTVRDMIVHLKKRCQRPSSLQATPPRQR
jgi:hypothetical protein